MARVLSISGARDVELANWQMALGEAATPEAARALDWMPAEVPGTAATALRASGKAEAALLADLHNRMIWYRTVLPEAGALTLDCAGLATHCTLWLDGAIIAESRSMFKGLRTDFTARAGSELLLQFHPLTIAGGIAQKRQRWRPHLVEGAHLRHWRTSLIGHMPGWCPSVPPVGPYRPVRLIAHGPLRVHDARLRASVEEGVPVLDVALHLAGAEAVPVLACAGKSVEMMGANGVFAARLALPDAALWWPHTHGEPALHAVRVVVGETTIDLGRTGFRTLTLDRGADGRDFSLSVNGVPVFCRGAVWLPPDVERLAGAREVYDPLVGLARQGGMNMLRIPGIATYESPAFFECCAENGILVWQDLMLANADYDLSPAGLGPVLADEVDSLLDGIEACPALAVVAGGSEMAQQGAMLSLPETVWRNPVLEQDLPLWVAARRPDVVVLPNSPWGGDLPFRTDHGVSHYFGVGAYRRPLEDARRAGVRFAAECLAFAHLPQPERLGAQSGDAAPGSPDWNARIVRDLKADWTFEDTRDHYLAVLYGVDPDALKRDDPARYLALSAAVPGEVMETTLAEWRRTGSPTRGALVLALNDVQPGFGWGVIDAGGVPKPAFHALARAFCPLALALTDEGLNGLDCHVINDTPHARAVTLSLTAHGPDGAVIIDGSAELVLPAHSALRRSSAELFGIFFDITAAYGFGAAPHVVSVAQLADAETGVVLAESFHFPLGRAAAMAEPHLEARLIEEAGSWSVEVQCRSLAQSIHLDAEGFRPADDWFHLAPGAPRCIALFGEGAPRRVTVTALNARGALSLALPSARQ